MIFTQQLAFQFFNYIYNHNIFYLYQMRIKIIAILIIGLSLSSNLFSAPPPPPSAGKPKCWPPPCVPIDGGISILMAAGALFGGKKLYDKSKKNHKE